MPFGRKAAAPRAASAPEQVQPSAGVKAQALLIERDTLESTLADYRRERARLIRESEAAGPAPEAIAALEAQVGLAEVRLEWLTHQMARLRPQVEDEARAVGEADWRSHRPGLAAA